MITLDKIECHSKWMAFYLINALSLQNHFVKVDILYKMQ